MSKADRSPTLQWTPPEKLPEPYTCSECGASDDRLHAELSRGKCPDCGRKTVGPRFTDFSRGDA